MQQLPSGLDALVAQGSPSNGRRRDKDRKVQRHVYDGSDSPHYTSEDRAESIDSSPRFGDFNSRVGDKDAFQFQPHADVAALKIQFGGMLEADRILLRNVRRDVEELEDELCRIQDLGMQLKHNMCRDREENSTRAEVQKQLERQVSQAKGRLLELRENRVSMNINSTSASRDREHFSQDVSFLRNSLEEESAMLEKLKSANDYLERSHKAHSDHARQLGEQRKDVLELLETESRLLERDERQTDEARAALERLRREQGDSKGVAAEEVDTLRPRRPLPSAAAAADNWLHPVRTPPGSQRGSPDVLTAQRSPPVSRMNSPGIRLRTPVAGTPLGGSTARPSTSPSIAPSENWQDPTAEREVAKQHLVNQFNPHSWASSLVGGTFGLPAASVSSPGGDPRSREGV
jgi:hypothetical protein